MPRLVAGHGSSALLSSRYNRTTRGYNWYGQLGLGDSGSGMERLTPTPVTGLNGIAASRGYGHSLAWQADGSVWSRGDNKFGQLGLGTSGSRTDRLTPAQIATEHVASNLTPPSSISA
ncbi:RCC1 domain-containing protein [Methylotetracoccus oryzae]|uniref:hypothetical protein n=1 Tax=Methylotetracoccus oryzae TaxID=1919059 RepID=UPI001118ACEB|nr:hypothetical protein [Methylotetracoccus oryzae]